VPTRPRFPNITAVLKRPLFWLSLPLLLPQGLWLKRTARRLPPAAGASVGEVGAGPLRRLLLVGDSIIAGVGVAQLDGAMPGQLARAWAERARVRVAWQALGDNGASSRDLLRQLAALPAQPADAIFISVGVNDVTRLTTARAWRGHLSALLQGLRAHSPQATVVLAGVPPMDRFPALPMPLRQAFGWRAARLDAVGREVAAAQGARHVPTPVPDDPSAFAEDGYHPNAAACAVWAREVVAFLPG